MADDLKWIFSTLAVEKTADSLHSQDGVPIMVNALRQASTNAHTMKVAKIIAEMAKAGKL